MGKSYPYYPAMRLGDNAFGYSSRFLRKMLDPQSVWAPTGETYEETVAWAKLLGVTVFVSYEKAPGPTVFLNKPGCITTSLSACSPADLNAAIRDYAQNAKAPQVDDE